MTDSKVTYQLVMLNSCGTLGIHLVVQFVLYEAVQHLWGVGICVQQVLQYKTTIV